MHLIFNTVFSVSATSTLLSKMLRAQYKICTGRQTRLLHSAYVLRKKSDYEDTFIGEFEPPSTKARGSFKDPFAAFKKATKEQGDDPLTFSKFSFNDDNLDSSDIGFDDFSSGFNKTNRFKFDAMEDETKAFDALGQDDHNNATFDWSGGFDQWGKSDMFPEEPKNRYVMPQNLDMSPLRGNSDQISTHVIPPSEFGGALGSSAPFEKIFAKVMGEEAATETATGAGTPPMSHESEYESRETANLDAIRQASGVELSSINSPYVNLFNSGVPDMFVEICAEPDMDVRHDRIDSLDLKECTEVEIAMMEQLKKLIRLDSDYDILEFMNKQLDEIEDIGQSRKNLPSELPPVAAGFPLLLNESLQLLVEKFESPADSVALFDAVKTRSGNLYFATVSTDVYFTMIRIVWEFYRDLSTLSVLASDIALMNIKSRALIKAMEDIERDCYKTLESRKRRVPEYEESITARVHAETLRRFSLIINYLRRGLRMKDNRQRAFRLRGEVCTY